MANQLINISKEALGLLALCTGMQCSPAADVDPRMVSPPNAVTGKLPTSPPNPAKDEARTFRVLDDFRMDLLAAEPLVASPVAMAYDENGRAYVCEMRDYPYTDKAHHQRNQENPTDQPIGSMSLLEDTDGDGVFDRSTRFAEGLSWPTGVACWNGGVFVAATPDIWYFKDTDGDGKADIKRKVFTGFRKLNVQSVMNTLVWGLDNQIHGAGSSNGGQIRPADRPESKPFVMSRHDFRFEPMTEKFEVLSGGGRFGGTFDDWGHRFLCDIRNPAQHIVLPQRYLARNPYLAARAVLHDMAEFGDQLPVYRISQPEPWRVLRAKRWAGERDIVMPRSELVGAGVVTSSSGITSYRGAAYPEKYRDNVFVCECSANLLYRLQLESDGPTFKAKRVDGRAEMVASTDNWFRPVNFVNAPDGTLHVMDMYRENIEHPWSIPDDIHAAVDLENGRNMGRIWRLAPSGFVAPKPPRLGHATAAELVATLENPNSWWRETSQRLLVQNQDRTAVPKLRELAARSKVPQARLHAVWTLAGLNALTDEDVVAALRDAVPGVRENAIKLAESRLPNPTVANILVQLAADPDSRVRFQLAFTLGEIPGTRAVEALATIAKRDASDAWVRPAVLSSTANTSGQLLALLLTDTPFVASQGAPELVRELAQVIGLRAQVEEMQRVLQGDLSAPIYRDVVAGIGEGAKRSGRGLRQVQWNGETSAAIARLLDQAKEIALDARAALDSRVTSLRLLTFDDFDRVQPALRSLLQSGQPQEIQLASVSALATFPQPDTASMFLTTWRTATPAVRSEIVTAMLGGRNRIVPFLKAVESGLIPANQIPFARRAALLRHNDAQVRDLSAKVLGEANFGSRKDAIARYQPALSMKGDRARGKAVFEALCATCHRAGELGQDVGPNLASIRQWNPGQLLANILDPNREIASNFLGYSIETRDGRALDGLIAADNAASITLKQAGGRAETILRSDIAQLSGSGLSLMPEGLESAISVEQMADLIAFLLAP